MTANQAGPQSYEHWEPHDANAALRNQITRTRADLGDTITELAARTDVKARAREAVAQVRSRARDTMRSTALSAGIRTRDAALSAGTRTRDAALSAGTRTRDVARSGATSARQGLDRAMRSPASVPVGAGVGALAGLGIYALVRRRLPLGTRLPFGTLLAFKSPRLVARMGRAALRRSGSSGQGRRR